MLPSKFDEVSAAVNCNSVRLPNLEDLTFGADHPCALCGFGFAVANLSSTIVARIKGAGRTFQAMRMPALAVETAARSLVCPDPGFRNITVDIDIDRI